MGLPITWGRGSGRARRRGLTFGSYDPRLPLIRIHPVLDRRDVPAYFVESVVYHEMLHHKLGGIRDRAGRTVYHSRRFREAEASYPSHRQALAWERIESAATPAGECRTRSVEAEGCLGPTEALLRAFPHLRRLGPLLVARRTGARSPGSCASVSPRHFPCRRRGC